ncbi:hypothetical protein OSSY52_19070 [Tepiditoga spiralis]|uniref:Lactate permease n=1 Tax=Tepiditoga spiralis TaxID=2108365 RepID=A0A7G1G8L8_9BACT|nr:hypothetical protein [Tepiditoga spiralis]BBE31766.1 hypothetical protein OSSY52_19070 [Tepiditoga spiralis]
MSNRTDRFFKRKEKLQNKKELYIPTDRELVIQLKNSNVDTEKVNKIFEMQNEKFDFSSNDEMKSSANEILAEIRGNFDQEKFDNLIFSLKEKVLDSIIKPFGLEKILFEDKDGGNITTEHNFKKGITSTEFDNKKYNEWQKNKNNKFDRKPYEKDFSNKRKEIFNSVNKLKDGYTGKEIPKDGRSHLDHITSAHEIEITSTNNLYLTKEKRIDMANSNKNLTMTDSSLNQSKNNHDLMVWSTKTNSKNNKITNTEKYDLDIELVNKNYNESKKHINKTVRNAKIKKNGTELLTTGGREGIKMGLQQSLGILIKEFTEALFVEIKDIYRNGLKNGRLDKTFLEAIKDRLQRISKKVLSKWKDLVSTFKDGVISGFFSNLITYIINTFLSTGKRFVRIIREGFFSLLKAIKILIMPPKGFTFKQAAHEATKLISTGVIVSGGILIEEGVEKFLQTIPGLNIFAQIISPVIIGIITGLLSVLTIYFLDKIDLFKVNEEAKHEFVMNKLEKRIEEVLEESDNLYSVFEVS